MAYKDGEVQIIQVDPFHPQMGLLFPFILQRILAFSRVHFGEIDPLLQARDFAMRACGGDPNFLLLAFVAPDGKLVGHAVCIMSETYGKRWLFVTQSAVDEPAGDLIPRAINVGKAFARARGGDLVIFETKRSDSAWTRALGAKTARHLMYFPLNGEPIVEAEKGVVN